MNVGSRVPVLQSLWPYLVLLQPPPPYLVVIQALVGAEGEVGA